VNSGENKKNEKDNQIKEEEKYSLTVEEKRRNRIDFHLRQRNGF
jgi:hypothetical protein